MLDRYSVNHIVVDPLSATPIGRATPFPPLMVTVPLVVISPIEWVVLVNHRAPLRPGVIAPGWLIPVPVKLVTAPAVLIRPIESLPALVNHNAPSGPAVIPPGD